MYRASMQDQSLQPAKHRSERRCWAEQQCCKQKAVGGFLVLSMLYIILFPVAVRAMSFQLRNLTEDTNTGVSSTSFNASGTVGASLDPPRDFLLIEKTGTVTNLTQSQFGSIDGGAINDHGQAAVLADGDIHLFDGTVRENLTNGTYAGILLLGHALNNLGQIAFWVCGKCRDTVSTNDGLFFFDGIQFIHIVKTGEEGEAFGSVGSVALNDRSQIAFQGGTFDPNRADMFLYNGTKIINLSNDPALQITDVNACGAINDQGQVLFCANTTTSPNNLFLFDGTTTINLTSTFALPTSASGVALNNNNQIAFVDSSTSQQGTTRIWFFDINKRHLDLVASRTQETAWGLFMNDRAEIVFSTLNFSTGQIDLFFAIPIPTPPVITVSATPKTLSPPNGRMVTVTISGRITDDESGVNVSTTAYAVTDEYGLIQPNGHIDLRANGSYSFTIQLQASRKDTDRDGRQYTITISAQNNDAHQGSKSTVVTVPHDQR